MREGELTCMPYPLGALCRLDHRAHERHGIEATRLACMVHDLVRAFWLRTRKKTATHTAHN